MEFFNQITDDSDKSIVVYVIFWQINKMCQETVFLNLSSSIFNFYLMIINDRLILPKFDFLMHFLINNLELIE